jgi:hypothetical protein
LDQQELYFVEAYLRKKLNQARKADGVIAALWPFFAHTIEEAGEKARAYFANHTTDELAWDGKVFIYNRDEWKTHQEMRRRGGPLTDL